MNISNSLVFIIAVTLVLVLIGAILVKQFSATELGAMFGAAVGLALGLLWVKGHTVSSSYFRLQQPVILRLATDELVVSLN